jgi:hypothetical protein
VASGPVSERDTYVLAHGVQAANVKIRWRRGRVKVKELVEREDDGFELWRTTADVRLPAGPDVWDEVARVLSLQLDTARLGAASHPAGVLEALRRSTDVIRHVEMTKERTSFAAGSAEVEVAALTLAGTALESIAFESADLAAARRLRSRLAEPGLGEPENYVNLCWRMLARSP